MVSRRVEIVETVPVKRGKLTVVNGFAGPGFIGNTAMMYLVNSKGFRQRAYVRSQLIPPMMILIDGHPRHAFRIYSGEEGDLLFVTCDMLISAENAWPVSLKLMEWLSVKGAETFISIEGMPFRVPSKERPVLGFSTGGEDLSKFGVHPTREGSISGMNACMLEECMRRNLSWISLLVPTDIVSTIDYGSVAAVIEVLNRRFKLGVDVTPLKQRDEMIRRMAERRMKGKSRGFFDALRGKQRSDS